jgi:hypothetical protein
MDLNPKYDDYDFPYTTATPQDGHAGQLTDQQIAQVHQLRMMLEAEGFTDRLDTLTLVRHQCVCCKMETRLISWKI